MSVTAGDKALADLSMALAASVPFAIADLEEKGGPKQSDHIASYQEWQRLEEEDPDFTLLLTYGPKALGRKSGDTAKAFALLTRMIAAASFCPGGIQIFGSHFVGGEENRAVTEAVYGTGHIGAGGGASDD